MDYHERKQHLEKIEEYTSRTKNIVENFSREEKKKINLNILNFGLPVFGLAYYGISVKCILENFVSIYKDIFDHYINHINNKCKKYYNKDYKKILFVSSRLCNGKNSVFNTVGGVLSYLSNVPDFHVDVMTCYPIDKNIGNSLDKCKKIIKINSIEKNIEHILSEQYDAIIYPDMNMDVRTSCIGMFRLAPVQINTFAHSESSGMADYFITSKYYEIDSKNNYTETPIEFDSLSLIYKNIEIKDFIDKFRTRQHFQLHKDNNIYYCNSSLFKMGKEMFDIFRKILDKDKKAIIVLTKLNLDFDYFFYVTMEKYLGLDYANRVRFLPRLSNIENMNLLYISDVFIESYPFGNMNSTFECFAAGLPVISMPTTKINGRFTYGYYKKMGLEKEYCAKDVDDYVDKAVSVANIKDKSKKQEILEKSKIIFEEKKSGEDWENFIRKVCE